MRGAQAVRACLLGITLLVGASCSAQPVDSMMDIQFYRGDLETPVEIGVAPTAIRAAAADFSPPPLQPSGEPVSLTAPYAGSRRNGHVAVAVGSAAWEIDRTVPLREAFPAQAILYGRGRVLVQQHQAWELFDAAGTALGQGARDPGDVTLDPENGRFYTNDPTGFVKANDLSSGELLFLLYPLYGTGYVRSVTQARGPRITFVGTELPVTSHRATRPPEYTIIELHDVGEPVQVDDERVIRSNRLLQSLITRPVPMLTAAQGEGLVLGAPGRLILLDGALRVTADLQDSFTPVALSTDETEMIYAVVRLEQKGAASTALWGVSSDGQRFLDAPVPADAGRLMAPPLVGFDRTVYLLLAQEVLAIDPTGDLRWRQHAGGEIAGAVVTADGQVLVTAGSRVLSIDASGERRLLFEAESDALTTAPALVSPDRLYVASARTLYRLRPME